jgi:hypothetical protein
METYAFSVALSFPYLRMFVPLLRGGTDLAQILTRLFPDNGASGNESGPPMSKRPRSIGKTPPFLVMHLSLAVHRASSVVRPKHL